MNHKLKLKENENKEVAFYGKESFADYRRFLGQNYCYSSNYGLVFKLNPNKTVDYLNPKSYNDFFLDMLDAGMKVTEKNFQKMMTSASVNQINPLQILYSQLSNNKWDNIDRISGLIESMNLRGDYELNKKLITKWFCNAYALAFEDIDDKINFEVFSRVVFILHSDERAFGKTQFFRRMGMQHHMKKIIPNCDFSIYCEEQGIMPKDDEKKNNYLTENLIFMIDDIDNLLINGGGTLRSVVSQKDVTRRIIYTQINRTYKRTASLAGTSNNPKLLRDATENRYMVFTLREKMDFDFLNNLDVFQFWLQIQHLARSSSRYVNYDNNELKEIVRLSQPYLYTSPIEDFVSDNFSFRENGEMPYDEITKIIRENGIYFTDKTLNRALKRVIPDGKQLKRRVKQFNKYNRVYNIIFGGTSEPDLPF